MTVNHGLGDSTVKGHALGLCEILQLPCVHDVFSTARASGGSPQSQHPRRVFDSGSTLHVQLFRHTFRDRYSQTHNHPIPGRLEIIAPWQLLYVISTLKVFPGGEVILENSRDQATFKALTSPKVAIGRCMKDFAPKRGRNIIQEDDDDLEV